MKIVAKDTRLPGSDNFHFDKKIANSTHFLNFFLPLDEINA